MSVIRVRMHLYTLHYKSLDTIPNRKATQNHTSKTMIYFALILIYFTEYWFLNNGRIIRFKKTAKIFCISVRKFVIWHDLKGEKHIHKGYRFLKPGTHPKINISIFTENILLTKQISLVNGLYYVHVSKGKKKVLSRRLILVSDIVFLNK